MISFESRENILKALSDPKSLHSIAKDAFVVADKDSNGYIGKHEFELCVRNVSEFFGVNIKEITKEFNRLDTDNNGIIDFFEFKTYVKEIIEKILFV